MFLTTVLAVYWNGVGNFVCDVIIPHFRRPDTIVTRRLVSQRKVRSPSGHTPTRVIIGILYGTFLHQTPSNRKPSGHTPTRVIIGILYRIFLHQTPSNRIPAAFRTYSIYYIAFLLRLQRRTCRWTPCLLSVESREVTIIGNTWALRLAVDPTNG